MMFVKIDSGNAESDFILEKLGYRRPAYGVVISYTAYNPMYATIKVRMLEDGRVVTFDNYGVLFIGILT